MSDNQSPRPARAPTVDEQYKPTLWDYLKANYKLVIIGLGLLILGAVIGRLFPPFVLDPGFWREFLTGPPIAGLLAVGAAFVAFSTARSGNKTAQKHAEEEWWNRAEWSIGLALSTEEEKKLVGLKAISVLLNGAQKREDALIETVAREIVTPGIPVDRTGGEEDNDDEEEGGGYYEASQSSEFK